MVNQPVDLGRQLDVPDDTHRRLVPAQQHLGNRRGRIGGDRQGQIGHPTPHDQVEQASWRDLQPEKENLPLHHDPAALLPSQTLHCRRLLLKHMVQQEDDTPLTFFN